MNELSDLVLNSGRKSWDPAYPTVAASPASQARGGPRRLGPGWQVPPRLYGQSDAGDATHHVSTPRSGSSTQRDEPAVHTATPAVRTTVPNRLGRAGDNAGGLIRVPVLVNGRPVHALVDTAASHSYIAAHLVPETELESGEEDVLLATHGTRALTSGRAQRRGPECTGDRLECPFCDDDHDPTITGVTDRWHEEEQSRLPLALARKRGRVAADPDGGDGCRSARATGAEACELQEAFLEVPRDFRNPPALARSTEQIFPSCPDESLSSERAEDACYCHELLGNKNKLT
ncbi:uncharacterized protein LOC134541373 [Bacillus rossius redtenbacheri]|uniref:uncharacterized protein LOC134541373 n=1 Tax=Bacillus rossius redtenbacheri TaxID=93214 RepID=UPI002FDC9561